MKTQSSKIMEHLKFTEEDLQANRAGHLSERQQHYLMTDRRKNAILGMVLVALFVIGTAVLLFIGVRDDNRILQILGVLLMFCNAGVTFIFGTNWIRSGYDLKTNRVDTVEGTVQHVVRQFGRAQAGSIRIGEVVEVPTEPELFKEFAPGLSYRLYRTSHTHRLLSIEPVV